MATPAMREVRNEAIDRARANANEEWFEFMVSMVRNVAISQPELTTDAVWREAEFHYNRPTTHNASAIGPVMLEAIDRGYISRKEGFSRKSERPQSHGRLLRVFTSNLYKN